MKYITTALVLLLNIQLGYSQAQKPAASPEAEATEYVRYLAQADTGDTVDRLQTAVTPFTKGDVQVDLVAVTHLADKAYFDNINKLLSNYDAVLYELVGGPYTPDMKKKAAAPSGQQGELGSLGDLQSIGASVLGLTHQLDHIDYSPENFVHADADLETFMKLSEETGETVTSSISRAMQAMQSGKFSGIPTDGQAAETFMSTMLNAVLTGNSNQLKRTLAPILSQAESLAESMEGENGSVILSRRNDIAMKVLEEQLNTDHRSFAIFYGAAHMFDIEERLIEMGFKKGEPAWADAWAIDDSVPAANGPAPEITGLLQQLMDPNSEIMKNLEGLMKSMEGAAE